MRQKLNLITLGVDDIKKSDKSMEDLAIFPLGGISLALYPRKDLAEDTTLQDQPSEFSGMTISHNAKSEAETDEVINQVEKPGGKIIKPARKVFWGGYSGYLIRSVFI